MKQSDPGGFRSWIHRRKAQIRSTIWVALVLGTTVNLLPSLGNQFQLSKLWPLISIVLTGAVIEALMFFAEPRDKISLAKSQLELLNRIPPLYSLVRDAGEISIIGGTMKTFTDDARNLEALKTAISNGRSVRILLMHPSGGGVESTARARIARAQLNGGRGTTPEMLAQEIEHSIRRLRDGCGLSIDNQIRLYREHPTFSLYDFGTSCMLTVYTLGRGASSPAIYIPSARANSDFVSGLREGFKELWTAPTTEGLEVETHRKRDSGREVEKKIVRRSSSEAPKKN